MKLAMGGVAVVVCGVLSACAQTAPRIAFKHGEVRGRLQKNGLRFVVMPDTTTQLAEIDVRYEVGSREDPPGKAGLAHLVEHLMFQQRPDGPGTKPLMHVLQQATLNLNAYTNWDTTHYMLSARAEMLDALVKVEAMRMYYGCETICSPTSSIPATRSWSSSATVPPWPRRSPTRGSRTPRWSSPSKAHTRSNASSPSCSRLQAILSPGLSHTRLSTGLPRITPSGVPVKMMSPGRSVM